MCLENSVEEHTGASPALGVKPVVGKAWGAATDVPIVELGAVRDHAPSEGVVAMLTETRVPKKRPILARTKIITYEKFKGGKKERRKES